VRTCSTWSLRVSGFLTEVTQQIHSLRASGVMSSHFARAAGSEMRTFRKSAGTLCTAPAEIAFLVIFLVTDLILHVTRFANQRNRLPTRLRLNSSYGAPRTKKARLRWSSATARRTSAWRWCECGCADSRGKRCINEKSRPRRPCTSLARIVWLVVQPNRRDV